MRAYWMMEFSDVRNALSGLPLPVHWEDVILSYGCLASTEGIFGLLPTEWWEMQISARREWRGGREGKRRGTQLNRL